MRCSASSLPGSRSRSMIDRPSSFPPAEKQSLPASLSDLQELVSVPFLLLFLLNVFISLGLCPAHRSFSPFLFLPALHFPNSPCLSNLPHLFHRTTDTQTTTEPDSPDVDLAASCPSDSPARKHTSPPPTRDARNPRGIHFVEDHKKAMDPCQNPLVRSPVSVVPPSSALTQSFSTMSVVFSTTASVSFFHSSSRLTRPSSTPSPRTPLPAHIRASSHCSPSLPLRCMPTCPRRPWASSPVV